MKIFIMNSKFTIICLFISWVEFENIDLRINDALKSIQLQLLIMKILIHHLSLMFFC